LVLRLGITKAPEYKIKRIPRPGRDEFRASVEIYDGNEVISRHTGPTFRLSCEAAVSDAAWEAITSLNYRYRGSLKGTLYSYYPQRKRGSKRF